MYVVYLALEPFVRRLWPSMLVGWTRALSGRLRDPLIGRDCLVGVALGGTAALLVLAAHAVAPAPPLFTDFGSLLGLRGAASTILQAVNVGLQNGLITVFVYASLRAVFEWVTRTPLGSSRRTVASTLRMSTNASELVFVALAVAYSMVNAFGGAPTRMDAWFNAVEEGAWVLLVLVVLLRLGILAWMVMSTTTTLLQRMPLTLDSSALYAAGSWIAIALLAGLAVIGFRLATQRGRAGGLKVI